MFRLKVVGCSIAALIAGVVVVLGQGAQVDESKALKLIYVDQQSPKASDANDGTHDLPLKTIAKAAQMAEANNATNIGMKVLIAPGLYRETLALNPTGTQTDAPMVFEATKKGSVVISGSDAWNDWQKQGSDNVYTHPWPYKWGLAPYPSGWEGNVVLQPVVRRREIVFVDGKLLHQVVSPLDMVEGDFCVSEDKGEIRVWLPQGVTPAAATIEVATRAGLFKASRMKNVVLRGLVFQHDGMPLQGEAVNFSNCSGVLVEDCRFDWNNWAGLGFNDCHEITVRRSTANHNGAMGMTGGKVKSLLYEDTETSYNNWRGAWGSFTGWSVAGAKQLRIHDAVYRRHKSIGNQTGGFWFDFDCSNVVVEEALWADNETRGIFIEASEGPITLKNSVICFNKGPGVFSTNSKNITLDGNTICNNGSAQFQVTGQLERPVSNFETQEKMKIKPESWTWNDNVVVATGPGQALVDLSGGGVEQFLGTLKSSHNLWFDSTRPDAFRVSGLNLNLDRWQMTSRQDLDSAFGDPQFVSLEKRDFSVKADSPLKTKEKWAKRSLGEGGLGSLRDAMLQEVQKNWAAPYALTTQAHDWVTMDLKPYANRPLTGQDGWIGSQPLENLPPGKTKVHNVPFDLIDPVNNEGLAAVALRSSKITMTKGKSLPAEVTIPYNRKAVAIYFLHGCGYTSPQKSVEYQVIYQDGSKETVEILPLGKGSEHADVLQKLEEKCNIQDWWPTMPQFENENARKVMVVNTSDPLNSVRYLYTLQWVNPHPKETIKELRLISNPDSETSLMVLGITALQASSGEKVELQSVPQ